MRRIHWKALSLSAACLIVATYACGLVYEGFIADHYSGVFAYPFVDLPAAERAYRRLATNAGIGERELAARRLIESDPTNPDSWVAVSYVEFLKAGGMSPEAITALDHSYSLSFFDRRGGVWRIGYALENWDTLPVSLRKDVLTEAQVMLKDAKLGPELRKRLSEVQNPEGRLAAIMVLAKPPSETS